MNQIHPTLSIVVTARNDNHGGELLKRIQIFIDGIFYLTTTYRLHTELVIVEWNPPKENPKLEAAIQWPMNNEFCSVKIIEVPSEVHHYFSNKEKIPLHQMIGKNVGIRRATGTFILVTNIDIVCSERLFEKIALGGLQKGNIYRTDRIDVSKDVPPYQNFEEVYPYFTANKIRIFNKKGTFEIDSLNTIPLNIHVNNTQKIIPYTNACGDFQLMHREDWYRLRGYLEFDIYVVHLDSILQYKAIFEGIEEVSLSEDGMKIYHIDHTGSWSLQTERNIKERWDACQIPSLGTFDLLTAIYCLKSRSTSLMSYDDWGFKDIEFPERNKSAGRTAFSSNKGRLDQELAMTYVNQIMERTTKGLQLIGDYRENMLTFDKQDLYQWVKIIAQSRLHVKDQSRYLQGKSMIIFGAGSYFHNFIRPVLKHFKVTPLAIIDNSVNLIGTCIDDVTIMSVNDLKAFDHNSIYILVGSSYYKEIKGQLEDLGYTETVHFINAYNPEIYWEV